MQHASWVRKEDSFQAIFSRPNFGEPDLRGSVNMRKPKVYPLKRLPPPAAYYPATGSAGPFQNPMACQSERPGLVEGISQAEEQGISSVASGYAQYITATSPCLQRVPDRRSSAAWAEG
ncbi:hypothetical protein ONZ45_g19655 [Pleurotus djamor]|nr:hypothetical protein ONZ45_g19655 [Pleurotus djamor]